MKSESDIEQAHRQDAEASGWFVSKIMRASPNGFPDRFYAKGGRVVLMEWKRPDGNGSLSAQQRLRIKQLKEAGVEVHVVDSVDDANRVLGIGRAEEIRTCLCGCGRRFRPGNSDQQFAFDMCRRAWERQQKGGG